MPNATDRSPLGENGKAPGAVPMAYPLNSAPPVPPSGQTPERAAAGDKWYAGLPESKALTGPGPFGKLSNGR